MYRELKFRLTAFKVVGDLLVKLRGFFYRVFTINRFELETLLYAMSYSAQHDVKYEVFKTVCA